MSANTKRMIHVTLRGLGFTTAGFLLATSGFAAPPAAHLENAQVFATGNKIQVFRVPTVDADEKTQYYDLTIELDVSNDGAIGAAAAINTVVSPNFAANKFIAGTYEDGNLATCTVATTILQGGRMEAALSCGGGGGSRLQASWITGLIPGHPFELDLKAAGIDKLASYSNYSWGKIGNIPYGERWWGCMRPDEIISATQVGEVITIGDYKDSNTQKCSVNLTKK
uniref:Uncharacterized protein n=1 Tax=Candidatus Kentrum sp. UNK TaxID=2126344 RepID=A0A451AVM7_9GAMM|nr:MAG: hypothetical protein BECKUNK1418G_GA0071005_10098 [Candidatus Kentron sp. UNK]VFK70111.1 MAG: hypothetical protein BECKUNK1418H_GA0071006_10248 [Candidatus Kentron sp. UNK]